MEVAWAFMLCVKMVESKHFTRLHTDYIIVYVTYESGQVSCTIYMHELKYPDVLMHLYSIRYIRTCMAMTSVYIVIERMTKRR